VSRPKRNTAKAPIVEEGERNLWGFWEGSMGLWYLTPLSTIFQLYHGSQFYGAFAVLRLGLDTVINLIYTWKASLAFHSVCMRGVLDTPLCDMVSDLRQVGTTPISCTNTTQRVGLVQSGPHYYLIEN
jgi:hypothetical protein